MFRLHKSFETSLYAQHTQHMTFRLFSGFHLGTRYSYYRTDVCVCVYMHTVGMHIHMFACIWRPEVNAECLSLSFHTYYF